MEIDKILKNAEVQFDSENFELMLNSKFKKRYKEFVENKELSPEEIKKTDKELVELFNELHEIEELDELAGKQKIDNLKATKKAKKEKQEKEKQEKEKQEKEKLEKEKLEKEKEISEKTYTQNELLKLGVPKNKMFSFGVFPKSFEWKNKKYKAIAPPLWCSWKIEK